METARHAAADDRIRKVVIRRPRLRSVQAVLGEKPRGRARPVLATVAGALAAAFMIVALLLLIGMRQDIASLNRTAGTQRTLVERQLEAIRQQVHLIRDSIDIQRSTRGDVATTTAITGRIESRMERLLRLIRQVRNDVDEMNRRTGGGATVRP